MHHQEVDMEQQEVSNMFKVGDKVRIREDLIPNTRYGKVWFVIDMIDCLGKEATIIDIDLDCLYLDIDNSSYSWSEEMLIQIVKTELVLNESKTDKFINDRILTYLKKNADYGNSADMSMEMFGSVAYAVRMSDKVNRIESLASKEAEVNDEKIEDTILDLVNYLVMYVSYGTDKPRLLSMIEEFYELVRNPEKYLKNLDILFRNTSDNKLTLKPATLKYIADYIKVLVK